ncbi:MAG TPA: ribose 1,5-bisphosphate isomerase, partial [Deltaproteobacteria bacterium]|nr:ribose 1,5-bisphosphate isomerase [Deltaproteobacteria bacterium]
MRFGFDNPLPDSVDADAVVVGAGPGGAAVSRILTGGGLRV